MADIHTYLARQAVDSPARMDRFTDMARWNRPRAIRQAAAEGIDLGAQHWDVITFLRQYYVENGWPRRVDRLSRLLDAAFEEQGGARHLYRLFPAGPLAQGTRIAGLPPPVNVSDQSFGSVH